MGEVIKTDFGGQQRDESGDVYDPHIRGQALCMNCRRSWEAVAPVGATQVECPTCGTMKGVFVNPVLFKDEPFWECNCGNEFFVIHKDRLVCAHCGTQQRFPDD